MGTQNQKANLERLALVKRLLNENKEVVPYERVLMSAASKRVAQTVINMLTEKYGTEKAVYCPVLQSDKTAYTDGRKIVVNVGCDYFKRCKTLEKKRVVEQGLYTHEAGHILFTDFKTFQDLLKEWESEKKITFPVKQFPYFSKTAFAEINDCFAKNQELITAILFKIQNIMEDAYIEERILQTYKGSVNTSLLYVRNFLISDLKKRYKENKDLCWHDALLSQARGCLPKEFLMQNRAFEKTARLFDANAKGFCSFFDRIGRSFSAMFLLWDKYIKPKVDEALLQEEMLRELLKNLPQDELKKLMEKKQQNGIVSSAFPLPDFIPSTAETKDLDSIPDGEVNEFNEDEYFDSLNPPTTLDGNKEPTDIGDTFSKNDEKSILSQTLNELSTTNEGLIERIADEIETFEISQTSLHKKVNCDIIHVRSGDENEYRRLALEAGVAKLSKALQKMVNAELFERRKGSVKRNLYSGKNLDLKSLANGSNKVFMQNKLPNKKPLISASILIDQSGSMSGEKIRHSIITAMVLEDFCRNLKIPFSITGHDVGCEGVRIFDYIDFGERNLSARNRLMRIQAGGCNRDGYAIRYVLNKMARRNESTKLLFLLSDGLPNDGGYGSASLIADLKEMQPIFRANRVILVPLCIDKNSLKSLRNIYGASLVDATNLQKLPYTLNQLLVKEIKKIL